MFRKILGIILAVLLILSTAVTAGAADTSSNSTGGSPTGDCLWYYLGAMQAIVIKGEGRMEDFYRPEDAPWREYFRSIKRVIIDEGVTNIGSYAFSEFIALEEISIGGTVTSIGAGAFSRCESLTSVEIPDSVSNMEENVFYSCINLNSVKLSNSLTTISRNMFSGCRKMTNIQIPTSVTKVASCAFGGCESLSAINIPGTVKSIGEAAFTYCGGLKSVTIQKGTTTIEPGAFSYCSGIESVTISSTVSSIGVSSFIGCKSLTYMLVNDDNKFYSSDGYNLYNKNKTELILFTSGRNEESFTIPDSVIWIGQNAFYSCSSLTDITIPNSVVNIGSYAFYECTSLKNITIPDSVVNMDYSAFVKCTNLSSVKLSENLTSISIGAFCGCSSLTSIKIPDKVTSIGSGAFKDCTSLSSITIPDSVNEMDRSSFSNTAYYNDENNWDEYKVLYLGKHLIDTNNPQEWKCCIKIGTKYIVPCAFTNYKKLSNIEIPKSIKKIGSSAFISCNELKHVYYYGSSEEWNNISIEEYNTPLTSATIHFNASEPTTSTEPTESTAAATTAPPATEPTETTAPATTAPPATEPIETTAAATTAPPATEPTETTAPTTTVPPATEPTETTAATTAPPATEPTLPSEQTETQSQKTDISNWNVSGIKNKTYTGKVIEQDNIIVSKNGKHADFSVKYKNNINVGTAKIIITGTGEYTGEIVRYFKINKAANPITVKVTTKTVKLAMVKKKTQTVKAITVSKAQGKVSYKIIGVPKEFKKLAKINSKGVITLSKWVKARKGIYKIIVTITAAGNRNYNSKSLSRTVTIKIR